MANINDMITIEWDYFTIPMTALASSPKTLHNGQTNEGLWVFTQDMEANAHLLYHIFWRLNMDFSFGACMRYAQNHIWSTLKAQFPQAWACWIEEGHFTPMRYYLNKEDFWAKEMAH